MVEDEFHFIIHCPQHENEREVLFSSISLKCAYFNTLNSQEKFLYILGSDDKLPFAKFLLDTSRKIPSADK